MMWFVSVIFAVLTIVICKSKDTEPVVITDSMKNNNYKTEIYAGIFTSVVLFVVAIIMFTGSVTVKAKDNKIVIETSYYSDDSISYDEIESIEYRESYKAGSKNAGFNSYRLDMGRFKNDEFNYYTIYVNRQCKNCIVIRTKDDVIVINQKTAKETKKLYEDIKDKVQ